MEFLNSKVKFISAYCPRYTPDFIRDLDLMTSTDDDFFILGDLNAHHLSWNCAKYDAAGNLLFNHQNNNNNYYIYIFHLSPIEFSKISPSDRHRRLTFCYLIPHYNINKDIHHIKKKFLDFHNANWNRNLIKLKNYLLRNLECKHIFF